MHLKTKSPEEFKTITNSDEPKETINITTSSDINNFIIIMYNNFILKCINNGFEDLTKHYFGRLNYYKDDIRSYNDDLVSRYNGEHLSQALRARNERYYIGGGNGELNNYKLQFLLAEIYKRIKIIEC